MFPATFLALAFLASQLLPAAPRDLPIAAFTSKQYWGTDMGGSVKRLGWPHQAVLLVYASRSRPTFLSVPERCSFFEAALAPTRDLIAYSSSAWGDDRTMYVIVADLSGREVMRFPRALRFRWSPAGTRLAVAYARLDSNWRWRSDGVEVWRRSNGSRLRFHHAAEDLRWRGGDTLLLLNSDRVEALDLVRDRLSQTNHHGPDLSPDRRFSMRHYTPVASGTELYDDRDSLNLSHCTLSRFNAAPLGGYAPFWVRGSSHLLCASIGDGVTAPVRQTGLEAGVFDPVTLAMVARFPGKPVVPTADGSAVVVVRADTLAVESIADAREAPRRSPLVRVRTELQTWGSDLRTVGVWTDEVAEGEWVPDHGRYNGGGCGRFLRVARVIDRDHIEVEVPERSYVVEAPGAPTTEGGITPVSRTPIRMTTKSVCGGATYHLPNVDHPLPLGPP